MIVLWVTCEFFDKEKERAYYLFTLLEFVKKLHCFITRVNTLYRHKISFVLYFPQLKFVTNCWNLALEAYFC